MFGFSLTKLLVLAAIVAAVWYGFRWVQRLQKLQQSAEQDKVERGAGPSSQELVPCVQCGVFVPASGERSCDRADCPG